MIIKAIKEETEAIKNAHEKIGRYKDAKTQKGIDQDYRDLVDRVYALIQKIKGIYAFSDFRISEEDMQSLQNMVGILLEYTGDHPATAEGMKYVRKNMKKSEEGLKKSWQSYYTDKTASTLTMLSLFEHIDSEKILPCIHKIEAGKEWDSDIQSKKLMMESLKSAENIITSLNADKDIISFVIAVNNHTATVKMMNSKITDWLQQKQIDDKIYLTFKSF